MLRKARDEEANDVRDVLWVCDLAGAASLAILSCPHARDSLLIGVWTSPGPTTTAVTPRRS
jgi:hypothetical protein